MLLKGGTQNNTASRDDVSVLVRNVSLVEMLLERMDAWFGLSLSACYWVLEAQPARTPLWGVGGLGFLTRGHRTCCR
ncbi:hypothetical protein GCM10027273_44210 [Nocardioides pakistanensis]